jgi:hypothetical protein
MLILQLKAIGFAASITVVIISILLLLNVFMKYDDEAASRSNLIKQII